jgi:signal transduction histidine kinase
MTSSSAPPASATDRESTGFFTALARDSAFLLAGLPIALLSFVVMVGGLSLSAGLAILVIGAPLAVMVLESAGWFAALERRRLAAIGHPVGLPVYRPDEREGWGRYLDRLRDPVRWAEVAHGVALLPVALLTWSAVVIWWVGIVVGLTSWAWRPLLPDGAEVGLNLAGIDRLLPWASRGLVDLVLGIVLAATIVPVLRACVALHTALATALLSPDATLLQQQVEHLAQSRAQAAHAEAESLRRLERDLHDGPQQRLIRLGMDLSAADRRLAADDVEQARVVLAEARLQTEATLAELRALSRGIAPPVLADRGLVAALVSAAATSPVPTALRTDLAETTRLPAAVENAAYFVACEALANVAKHAGATHVELTLVLDDGVLDLVVADDGRGGAQVLPGHGLAGLHERAAGVDGVVEVVSTPGHGTMVRVRIPCASS